MESDTLSSSSPEEEVRFVVGEFARSHNAVRELLNFDRIVLDFAINGVRELHNRLHALYARPQDNGEHTLRMLQNIRTNDSMRPQYQVISNQGIVLLVSYISSALEDLFKTAFRAALVAKQVPEEVWDTEFKASFAQLVSIRSDGDGLIDLVVAKQDINFQDMQSTVRSFQKYVGVEVTRDQDMDDIVFAQAARHAIVHNAGIADAGFFKQIEKYAAHRSISRPIAKGDRIQFTNDEVLLTGASMLRFVERVGAAICVGAQKTPTP